MTREDALAVARRHIAHYDAKYPLSPDFRREVPEPVEYRDFWYFNYVSVHVRGLPPEQWDVSTLTGGGPAGFVVSKRSGAVQNIAWMQLPGLRAQEAQLIQFEQLAAKLARQPLTLKLLRAYFRLPLPALQVFRQELVACAPEQRAPLLLRQLMQQADFTPLLADETKSGS